MAVVAIAEGAESPGEEAQVLPVLVVLLLLVPPL
jgi:hypothetical protein